MLRNVPRKVEYLDGLRGIAALVVVIAHFKELFLPGTKWKTHFWFEVILENSPVMLLVASSLAVLIFFVHSGFVLSWKYLNAPDRRVLVSMAARRAFRLGIPIAASVWLGFTLMRLGLMYNKEVAEISGSSESLAVIYNFYPSFTSVIADSLGGALVMGSVRYNGALWTMPIELFCSYLVFLILPFVVKTKTPYLFIAFGMASIALIGTVSNVVCFLVGILLVRMYREGYFSAGGIYRLFASKISGTAIIGFTIPSIIYTTLLGRGKALQVVCAVIVILMVLTGQRIQRMLGSPIVKYLGKLSFSAYLVHVPILCSLSSWLFLNLFEGGFGYGASMLLTFVATIPTVYLVAWLMTVTVDQKAINFGKRTMSRLLEDWSGSSETGASGLEADAGMSREP